MSVLSKQGIISLLVLSVSLGLLLTGCPKPMDVKPTTPSFAEVLATVSAARTEARAQWADTFAQDIYRGAEELLATAQKEKDAGNLEMAHETLIRARERFNLAAELAPKKRDELRRVSSEEAEKVRCVFNEVEESSSWTCSPRKIQMLKQTLDEAQTAHEKEDYIGSMEKAKEARELLDEALIESAETKKAAEDTGGATE